MPYQVEGRLLEVWTIPGAPAYVGRASQLRVSVPEFEIDVKDHSSVSTTFRFTG